MFSLYTDAATQPQTGLSAGGILIIQDHHQTQLKTVLTATTNHTAEFEIARIGFEHLLTLTTKPAETTVLFYTDSQIVSDSVAKRYAKHYQLWVDALLAVQDPFQLVLTQWVPERENRGAHTLANQALHSAEDVK